MQANDIVDESDTGPTHTACKGSSDMDRVNDTKKSLRLKKGLFPQQRPRKFTEKTAL